MKQKIPHKHAELIKKWADDDSLKIEFKSEGQAAWIEASYPSWDKNTEYRIKPEVILYRVAKLNKDDSFHVAKDEKQAERMKELFHDLEWLTDWIEVEV